MEALPIMVSLFAGMIAGFLAGYAFKTREINKEREWKRQMKELNEQS